MSSQKPPYDLGDLSKLMSEFKIPEIDWRGLIAAQQKNLAALGQANQVWLGGAQTVVRREIELMEKAMAEAAEASKELMQEGDARAAAEKRLDLARRSFETAIGNMRELSELATKSNREALDVIHQRAMALRRDPGADQGEAPASSEALTIAYDDFARVDIRIGTILNAVPNTAARKPALILEVDFGATIGTRKTSAQLTELYDAEALIGRQVAAVLNFPPKQVAKVISEVLVLGFPDTEGRVVLVGVDRPVPNGGKLF